MKKQEMMRELSLIHTLGNLIGLSNARIMSSECKYPQLYEISDLFEQPTGKDEVEAIKAQLLDFAINRNNQRLKQNLKKGEEENAG